ncbi:S8 family serine peptidase [Adhaeribacter radiodurans]|uniref:S8 family serine peptidase n=1 Tax=Adhaeribacter radiodurans TaxID=2745197 RepID=A0A7L7LAT9_9BACT|nr:S8 family serine peptidase [Adhaeribacter radiodurans]QMU29946.1 S8 family serine peptidase [Adhaeribacter radiodurans]
MITRFSFCFLVFFSVLSLNWFASSAQNLRSANQETTTARTQPKYLLIKLKPNSRSTGTPQRQASAPFNSLQQVLAQIKTTSYRPKFPETTTISNLKPGQVDLSLWYEVQFQNLKYSFPQLRRMLLSTGMVDQVEPVYVPEVLYQPNDPLADSVTGNQYYLKQIHAYKGWDTEKGDSTIVIGILDTGTRLDHEDLIKNLKHNYADPIDGVDNDNDGYIDNFTGWDTADNDNDANAGGHGTFVSGIAAGTPDNNTGMAGVGFNCRYLPIKVFSSDENGSFGGYEGIKYAADHGCQVINLSWGGENPYSQFEQDVINYAVINKNAIIVAAAGNTPKETFFYPASYENVLAVSSVDQNDVKVASQTFNYAIDLTAPGISISTTSSTGTNTYARVGGSSMASPLVAGAAGLLRKKFPNYTARQVAEHLRVTTDNIYAVGSNNTYLEKLGHGRLNVYQALTTAQPKAVRNTENTYDYQRIYAGNVLPIIGTFENVLTPTQSLIITLSSSSPYVSVIRSTYSAGAMGSLTSKTNTAQPFQVLISKDIPANQEVSFRYGFSDGTYTDYQYFTLLLNSNYVTLKTGDLDATVTSLGNIGFNGANLKQGESVIYKNFGQMLSEGGLLVGNSPEKVSDHLRTTPPESDEDFTITQGIRFVENSKRADEEAYGAFKDRYPRVGSVGVKVKQRAFAWQNTPYIILEYQLTNTTSEPLTNLHAGLFADWDIGDYTNNAAVWDSVTRTGYTFTPDKPEVYAGITLLTDQPPTTYAIRNPASGPEAVNLADGFSNTEKFRVISNSSRQNQNTEGSNNDVSQVVGGVLPNLLTGETTTVAFAILGAEALIDLKETAQAARAKYQLLKSGPVLVKQIDSVCQGETLIIRPTGGKNFKFYADSTGKQLLNTGPGFTIPPLQQATTYYISNVDSLYESPLTAMPIVPANSPARFAFSPNPVFPGANGRVHFTDQTVGAKQWNWNFGNGTYSQEQNPTIQYTQPGKYLVTLQVTNQYGCLDSLTQTVEIKYLDYIRQWQESDILVYPIPTYDFLTIAISEGIDATQGLTISLVNVVGQQVLDKVTYQNGKQAFDLRNLANGIYYLRIQGQDGLITRRVEVLR